MYWFWWFMLLMNLLIPSTMLGFGARFLRHPPKRINSLFGYRSSRSMQNGDTWLFAHHCIGRIWLIAGAALLVLSAIAMLPLYGPDTESVGVFGGVLCGAQVLVMFLTILPVEIRLKRTFDRYGRRAQP